MSRVKPEKRTELEAFWRFHHDEWVRGTLNQREYCELHGLPLKRFGNWRAEFKAEDEGRKSGLLYRRGGLEPMSRHMSDRDLGALSAGYIPSAKATPEARRSFSLADKKRIVTEACRGGASLSAVARRHGISRRLLFRWKSELAPDPPTFLPVVMQSGHEPAAPGPVLAAPAAAMIIERATHEIEIELKGGRRLRFSRDTDPATVRAMMELLEGVGA